jgi:hypothetical protein
MSLSTGDCLMHNHFLSQFSTISLAEIDRQARGQQHRRSLIYINHKANLHGFEYLLIATRGGHVV